MDVHTQAVVRVVVGGIIPVALANILQLLVLLHLAGAAQAGGIMPLVPASSPLRKAVTTSQLQVAERAGTLILLPAHAARVQQAVAEEEQLPPALVHQVLIGCLIMAVTVCLTVQLLQVAEEQLPAALALQVTTGCLMVAAIVCRMEEGLAILLPLLHLNLLPVPNLNLLPHLPARPLLLNLLPHLPAHNIWVDKFFILEKRASAIP